MGDTFDFQPVQKGRLEKKARKTKRYQRKMARGRAAAGKDRRSVGANYRKTKAKMAKSHLYGKNVREDFAHKTSKAIVEQNVNLIVFEDLNVKGMTKKPKPQKDEHGKRLHNRAAAKAGLNKKILNAAWGKTVTFTQYKARKTGRLCIKINPYQTSQECAECGHIHSDNRVDRPGFVCHACGHQDNADHNAGRVIALRGAQWILSGEYRPKVPKRCAITRRKEYAGIGPVLPESAPGESIVSRLAGNGQALGTRNQETLVMRPETPATTALAV